MPAPPPFRSSHQPTTFLRSFLHAWNGLIHTIVHQRNMRMHVIAALLVGQVGSGLTLGLAERVTLVFCVLMVFFAEMLNSALEQLVDLATEHFDERARLTKDIAAAGVLVLALGTVVIFAAILVANAATIITSTDDIVRQVQVGAPLTFLGGALMHESRKSAWLDALFGLLAAALWLYSLSFTHSVVFSAMTLGLLVLCASTAIVRQRRPLHRADT